MKHLFTICFMLLLVTAFCQSDNKKILEQRAKDFHQAISRDDKEGWRKYMKENFTTALIERPMRAQVSTSESDGSNSTSSNSETKIDAKLAMFQQLHDDFGNSKIGSVKVSGNKVVMTLGTGEMKGVFSFDAEPNSPWLIDKFGVEVNVEN